MNYFFDTHQDIADAILYASHCDFWKENGLHEGWNDQGLPVNNQTDFVRLQKANVKAVFGVSCALGVTKGGEIFPSPTHYESTLEQIAVYNDLVKEGNGKLSIIKTKDNLATIYDNDLNILLTVEGADCLVDNENYVEHFWELGVRCIGLTWSFDNGLAGGCNGNGELTRDGEKVIRAMDKLGILLDLSHINEKSSFQALEVSRKPVIISHTAVKSIHDHPRNVTDQQMLAVAKTGGAIGVCGVPGFISDSKDVYVEDVVNHIMYGVELIGIDHIVIGSDFGAMTAKNLIPDFSDVTHLANMALSLKNRGLSDSDIEKICHGNIERILKEVLP